MSVKNQFKNFQNTIPNIKPKRRFVSWIEKEDGSFEIGMMVRARLHKDDKKGIKMMKEAIERGSGIKITELEYIG